MKNKHLQREWMFLFYPLSSLITLYPLFSLVLTKITQRRSPWFCFPLKWQIIPFTGVYFLATFHSFSLCQLSPLISEGHSFLIFQEKRFPRRWMWKTGMRNSRNESPSTAVQRVHGASCGWKIENGTFGCSGLFHQANHPVPELSCIVKLSLTLLLGL